MTDKSEIRRKIKNMRKMLDEADKAIAAEAVFNQLEKTAAFIMAKRILMKFLHTLFCGNGRLRNRFFCPVSTGSTWIYCRMSRRV